MAQTEELRRNGAQADWPEPTMDDVKAVIARGLSQVDARMEVAILGTGENPTEFTGILSDNTQRLVQISTSRDYDASAMQSLTERMKPVVQSQFMGEVIDRNDRDAQLARYLARSPLSYLASEAGKNGGTPEVLIGPASMSVPQSEIFDDKPAPVQDWRPLLRDAEKINATEDTPVSEPDGLYFHPDCPGKAVRYNNNLVPDSATMGELTAKLHAFLVKGHDCDADACAAVAADLGPCGACCHCLSGCVYDDGPVHDIDEVEFTPGGEVVTDGGENDYPDVNWCHVHNRQAIQGREECALCMAETCERCNYDTHRCKGCGEPLEHGTEVCTMCTAANVKEGDTSS